MAARQTCSWICCLQVFIIALILSLSESADLISRCPSQLPRTYYLKAAEWGKCYEFHLQERTWKNANNICAAKGGNLVTIKAAYIQEFLIEALTEYKWPRNGLWIGATDKDKEMEWVWVTGEKVKDGFTRWASGQPSCGFFCFEDCALMRWKEGGRWHDYRCNWLEDYSSICEYDMMPEPTTKTTPTTTSAVTTTVDVSTESTSVPSTINSSTKEVDPDNTTSTILAASARTLNSEYLLRAHGENKKEEKNKTEKEEKNNTDNEFPPAGMLQGIDGARAEQVQERVSASSSRLDSGALALIIVAVLTTLGIGLCFVLIFMRRRHRKRIREDDRGISYENPNYEEAKICRTGKRSYSVCDDTDAEDDTNVNNAAKEGPGVFSGKVGLAAGITVTAPPRRGTDMKQPPSPLHSRQKRVMNNYDIPPALTTQLLVRSDKRGLDKTHHLPGMKSVTKEDNRTQALPTPEYAENYYDEVRFPRPNSELAYDVPRSSRQQHYGNNDSDNSDELLVSDQMYYNSYDENIYESVDSLETVVEQQRPTQAEELYVPNAKGKNENRYVPFMFDNPKETLSETTKES